MLGMRHSVLCALCFVLCALCFCFVLCALCFVLCAFVLCALCFELLKPDLSLFLLMDCVLIGAELF